MLVLSAEKEQISIKCQLCHCRAEEEDTGSGKNGSDSIYLSSQQCTQMVEKENKAEVPIPFFPLR